LIALQEYPIYQSDTAVEETITSIKPQEWNAQMDQNGQVENYLWIQSMQKKLIEAMGAFENNSDQCSSLKEII